MTGEPLRVGVTLTYGEQATAALGEVEREEDDTIHLRLAPTDGGIDTVVTMSRRATREIGMQLLAATWEDE